MSKKTPKKSVTKGAEALNAERRLVLQNRKLEIQNALQDRIHNARADSRGQAIDEGEGVGLDAQDDITFALIETQAALIRRIDQALAQIDAGTYGFCLECHDTIAANRLRALPFAVRCTSCEGAIEQREERTRRLSDKIAPFSDTSISQ